MSARHADGVCAEDEEMVEVEVDPETEEEAAEQAIIVGGLVGSHVLIVPSTDHSSRNVRLVMGTKEQKRRTFTVDVQHLR
eukprot:s999_g5.t1